MSGEHIEDLSLDLLRASDAEVVKKCEFPEPGSSEAADQHLRDCISEQTLQEIRFDPSQLQQLKVEFRNIMSDR